MLYAYYVVLIGSLVIGLLYKKRLDNGLYQVLYLLITTAIVETVGLTYMKALGQTPHWPFALYHPIQYFFIAKYFSIILKKQTLQKLVTNSIVPAFILLAIYEYLHRTFSLSVYYESLFISFLAIIGCILYLRQLLNADIEQDIVRNPYFWVCTGMLLFHAGSFLLMGFLSSIYDTNKDLAKQIFVINPVLNIFYYGLFSFAFYLRWKQTR